MPFAAVNRWLENIYCTKKIMLDEFIELLEDILLPLFCVYLKYLCVLNTPMIQAADGG